MVFLQYLILVEWENLMEVKFMDETVTFSLEKEQENDIKKNLLIVYNALKEKGYNPVNQIVGYILSEDPTYITTHNSARSLIRKIDRDELLQVLVETYIKN